MPRKKDHDVDKSHPAIAAYLACFPDKVDYRELMKGREVSANYIKKFHAKREENGLMEIVELRGHEYLVDPVEFYEWQQTLRH